MAANDDIRDEDADTSDWLEIYNPTSEIADLRGWFLTDQSGDLAKWAFPDITIPPYEWLFVWASGKNRTNQPSALHTNFRLSKQGGFVALVKPDGSTVASSMAYPVQYDNISYGVSPSDATVQGYTSKATPGGPNDAVAAGFGPDVQFSIPSRAFKGTLSLELTATGISSTIHYLLITDSADPNFTALPDASSPVYTSPIPITGPTIVRACTIPDDSNYFPGPVRECSYIQIDASAAPFTSDLPIVVFHNLGAGDVPAKPGQVAFMQVFEPGTARSAMTNSPNLAKRVLYHRHGSSTFWDEKPNLRVETQDVYGEDDNVNLAGLPSENDWIFYAVDVYDKSALHNPLTQELYRQMGHATPRTRFVEVYIQRTGGSTLPVRSSDYCGLYVLEEKIKLGRNRVDIDKLWPQHSTVPAITGGYLLSIDRPQSDAYGNQLPQFNVAGVNLNTLDPDYEAISSPDRSAQNQYILNYLRSFYTALYGSAWRDPINGYAPYIDIDSWIDYHLHQVLVFNADMLRLSAYFHKPRNGPIVQGPLWDFDRSFATSGSGDTRGFNPFRWRSGAADGGTDAFNAANTFNNPWYARLFKDPDFFQKWIDRYQELRKSVYSLGNITSMIDMFAAQAREAAPRDAAKWRGMGQSDSSPRSGRISGDGYAYTFPTPGTYDGEVACVRSWFTNRVLFMDTNFLAQPAFDIPDSRVPSGQILTITAKSVEPDTKICYTLDGSDPRLPGGAISPAALVAPSPATVTITTNVDIRARAYNTAHRNLTGSGNPPLTSPWSGPSLASFSVSPAFRASSRLPDGSVKLLVTGSSDAACFLDVSTNLTTWTPLTNQASATGVFEFVDPAAGSEHRFYRARQ